MNPNAPTVEDGVNALISEAKEKVRSRYEACEDKVRQSPGKAVLVAVAAGYCLHRLPVRSLLVAQVRLLAALTPPALLAFGAAKLCEFLQQGAPVAKSYAAPVLRHAGELRESD